MCSLAQAFASDNSFSRTTYDVINNNNNNIYLY